MYTLLTHTFLLFVSPRIWATPTYQCVCRHHYLTHFSFFTLHELVYIQSVCLYTPLSHIILLLYPTGAGLYAHISVFVTPLSHTFLLFYAHISVFVDTIISHISLTLSYRSWAIYPHINVFVDTNISHISLILPYRSWLTPTYQCVCDTIISHIPLTLCTYQRVCTHHYLTHFSYFILQELGYIHMSVCFHASAEKLAVTIHQVTDLNRHTFTGAPGETTAYTPHEGPISTNQTDRKFDVYDRKLEGNHSMLDWYFDKYLAKTKRINLENAPLHNLMTFTHGNHMLILIVASLFKVITCHNSDTWLIQQMKNSSF